MCLKYGSGSCSRGACSSSLLSCVDGRAEKPLKFFRQWRCSLRSDHRFIRRVKDHGRLVWRLSHSPVADNPVETDAVTDGAPNVQKYKGERAVVVGAGPAGLTAAAYLAKHGFSVKVFESREDIRSSSVAGSRAHSLGLSGSTIDVLREVGVDLPDPEGGFKNELHVFRGAFAIIDDKVLKITNRARDLISATRHGITMAILDAVECSPSVTICFEHRCKRVSFKDQNVIFENLSGKQVIVGYDLLIGADGANSRVRQDLEDFDKDFQVHTIQPTVSYIGLRLKVPEDDFFTEMVKPGTVTFCSKQKGVPKKYKTFLAYARTSDEFINGVFFAQSEVFELIKGKEQEWINTVLPDRIPKDWKKRIAESLENFAVSKRPAPIFVSKFNGPRTILVGDAAHAVSVRLGYGCNMAITDGRVLGEALRAADGELDHVPQTFNDLRYKSVQCYQHLETGMATDGYQLPFWLSVWRFFFLLHLTAAQIITKLFSIKRPIAVHERVLAEEVGPIDAVNIVKRDCFVATAVVVSVLLFASRRVIAQGAKFLLSKILVV